MNKQIVTAVLLFFGLTQVEAQNSTFLDNTSIEVAYGVASPSAPSSNISKSNYISFSNFLVGANYQFDQLWGARLSYAYHQFKDKDHSNFGVNYNKIMAEATFNVMQAIQGNNNPFDIVAHAGIGGTFVKSKFDDKKEEIYNAQIGLKPTYAINDKFNIFADVTSVINFHQDLGYNGLNAKANGDRVTGNYMNVMIGVQYKLGN